jgi:hypothetical protein
MIVGSKTMDSFTTSFLNWDFLALDTLGKSKGILISWRKYSLKLLNSWVSPSVLGTHFFSKELNFDFLCINIYGPYLDRKEFWKKFFNSKLAN